MLEISNLISKSALCVSDATYVGKIENVYFENTCKKIAYFLIRTAENAGYLLPFECIASFGDVVTVDDTLCLKNPLDVDVTTLNFNILNKDVFTCLGDSKGKVEKVEFARSGNVTKIYTENSQFAPNAISKVGDVILLKSTPKQPKKKVTIPRPKTDYPVYLLSDTPFAQSPANMGDSPQNQPNMIETEQNSTSNGDNQELSPIAQKTIPIASIQSANFLQSAPPSILLSSDDREPMLSSTAFKTLVGIDNLDDEHTPTRVICNFDFLIGRVLSRDLRTFGGDIIAYAGTKVDESVLQRARRAGKLVELTLNSEKAE